MIKKLFSYIFLIFFTTNVTAEEIVMKCKYKKYKYIFKNSGDVIMSTKKKGKPKWVNWCPDEKNEELSYDYGFSFDCNYKDHICKCGSKNCVGFIIREGSRWRLKKQTNI